MVLVRLQEVHNVVVVEIDFRVNIKHILPLVCNHYRNEIYKLHGGHLVLVNLGVLDQD